MKVVEVVAGSGSGNVACVSQRLLRLELASGAEVSRKLRRAAGAPSGRKLHVVLLCYLEYVQCIQYLLDDFNHALWSTMSSGLQSKSPDSALLLTLAPVPHPKGSWRTVIRRRHRQGEVVLVLLF